MTDANGRKPLRIGAVADLHVHKSSQASFRQLFAEISEQADVLALSGDLTNLGLPEEAENLAADLASLRIPVVAVLGNHDFHSGRVTEVKDILRRAKVQFLDEEPLEIGDVGFAGTKGFGGGFGNHMLGPFGEDATKHYVTEGVNEALALENALKNLTTPHRVVVLHYSPVAETVAGEPPEIAPFLGCARLGETIDRFEVAAVFHGHAHHGSPLGRTARGVPVYNCCFELLRRGDGGRGYIVVEV